MTVFLWNMRGMVPRRVVVRLIFLSMTNKKDGLTAKATKENKSIGMIFEDGLSGCEEQYDVSGSLASGTGLCKKGLLKDPFEKRNLKVKSRKRPPNRSGGFALFLQKILFQYQSPGSWVDI